MHSNKEATSKSVRGKNSEITHYLGFIDSWCTEINTKETLIINTNSTAQLQNQDL